MRHNRMFQYMAAAAVVAVALVLMGAPFASLVPFAVFLACPLVMFFMMKNMGAMHGNATPPDGDARTDGSAPVDVGAGRGT